MNIIVNGEEREIADEATIAALLASMNVTAKHVAVEVNAAIVPRARHAEHTLRAGDRLEIVTLVGGG